MGSPEELKVDDNSSNDSKQHLPSPAPGQIPKALLDDAQIVTAQGNIIAKDGTLVTTNDQDSDFQDPKNPFLDPEVKAYYVAVYERSNYECRHVFDADLTWTKEEEKKIIRKLDLRGRCASQISRGGANLNVLQFVSGHVSCFSVSKLIAEIWSKLSQEHF
jgi:hypothetical protein